ncbi:MAG: serine O-acetyltransferase, partial [Gammaproteobacteria bacterium]
EAYGTTADMPDPIANAINAMLDHLHAVESRLETLEHASRRDHRGEDISEPYSKAKEAAKD